MVKRNKPPKGSLPPEFTIAGKHYIVQSVNVNTDEVVIIETKSRNRYSFDFYKLRDKINHLSK